MPSLAAVLDRLDAESVQILRRVAGPLDRIFRARLTWLVEGGGAREVGGLTALMALLIPPFEFVPFSVTMPAVALAGIGLGSSPGMACFCWEPSRSWRELSFSWPEGCSSDAEQGRLPVLAPRLHPLLHRVGGDMER